MMQAPRLCHALEAWPLFDRSHLSERWAVGSRAIDRYLTVPASSVNAIQLALELMDGTRSVEEITVAVRDLTGRQLDVERLAGIAWRAGLLSESSAPALGARSELDRFSLTLFAFPLQRIAEWIQLNARHLPRIWLLGQLATAVVATLLLIVLPLPPAGYRGPVPIVAVVIACFVSLLAHEASHCLVALDKGIKAVSLTVAIYAGIMPVMYVRLPGIFRLAPPDRLRVWIAGGACSSVIGLIAAAASRLPGNGAFWTYVAQWNFALVVVSLVPFLPTDGYFIASTILRTHNLRSRAYAAAASILRGSISGLDWKPVLFLIFSVTTLAVGIWSSASQWTRWAIQNGIRPVWGWGVPFVMLAFVWVFRSGVVALNEWKWRRSVKQQSTLARVRS